MRLTLFSGSVPAHPATSCILYFFPFCKCFLHHILQSLQRLPESTVGSDIFHPAYKRFRRLCRVLVLHINCIISSCLLYVNTLLYKSHSVLTYLRIKTVSADHCVVFFRACQKAMRMVGKKAKTINDNLEITYIEPPFSKNNYVYSDKDRNYGKGY